MLDCLIIRFIFLEWELKITKTLQRQMSTAINDSTTPAKGLLSNELIFHNSLGREELVAVTGVGVSTDKECAVGQQWAQIVLPSLHCTHTPSFVRWSRHEEVEKRKIKYIMQSHRYY